MTTRRTRAASLALLAVGGLVLTACGDPQPSAGASAPGVDCVTGSIKASGSSAQKNAIAEWVNAYQAACGESTIDYQGNGSSSGITDLGNKQVAFAGSDSPLKPADRTKVDARCSKPAINIPLVGGAIAVAYNVPGVDSLTLTPKVLAGIFNSTITTWNDPAIAQLNPEVKLPAKPIVQYHRSDGSGTTDNFTGYLAAAAGDAWTHGSGKEWAAPGGQGAKGSDGVTAAVKSTGFSIGYTELSFAQDAGLGTASIDNGGGAVPATSDAAAKTIAAAKVVGSGNDLALSLDRTVADGKSYPIVLVTYEIACEQGLTGTDLELTKSFLDYAAGDHAQAILTDIGYVPITGDLLTKVRASVAAIS